jgi:hypothetical protein
MKQQAMIKERPDREMNGAPAPATPVGPVAENSETVETSITEIAGHIKPAEPPIQASEITVPFSQREHTLMMDAVDKIATEWMHELSAERDCSTELEKRVIDRLAKLKNDLTQFFLLGNAICSKVKRDQEFHEKLHVEIDKLAEEPVT